MTAREEFVKALEQFEAACATWVVKGDSANVVKTKARVLAAYDAASQPVAGVEAVCWYDPNDFTRTASRKTDKEWAPLYAAPPKAEPAGWVMVKADTVAWLLGENGNFECDPKDYFRGKPTPYFWRKRLRESIAAPTHDAAGGTT